MPEVFSLASGEKRSSERVVLVGERPLAQAVKSFEHADPITLPFISPESRFDPGNVIDWSKKRFLKGLLLVKCAMILAKPVLPLPKRAKFSASNLKLLHGLSVKLSKLFQFYFQDLNVFFVLLQLTFAFVAYGR